MLNWVFVKDLIGQHVEPAASAMPYRLAVGLRTREIVEGRCVLHPTRELQWTEERNWFFRLTKYAPFLKQLITSRPRFIQPESRRNEILGLLPAQQK